MKKNFFQKLWAGSLISCGICGLILNVPRLFDKVLPDTVVEAVGIISLISVAALMFTTVKKMRK